MVTYEAPEVSNDREIKGSVTMVVGEFAPIVNYFTIVEVPKVSPAD